jgi:hypothetical protein
MIATGIGPVVLALALPTLAPGGSDWRIDGGQAGAQLGSALATADVNGDGFGDLIAGAPAYDDLWRDEGRVTVYLGSPGGLSSTPAWTRYGRQRDARFGTQVANAGDVNGDGFEDVLVAAPEFDRIVAGKQHFVGELDPHERFGTEEGRVQLFLGSAAGLSSLPQRTLTGIERGERFGASLAGAGDVNGDGFDDVLIGATGKSDGLGALFLFAGTAAGLGPLPVWIEIGPQVDAGWGSVVGPAGDVNEDGFADLVASAPGFVDGPTCGRLLVYGGSALGPDAILGQLDRRIPELGPSLDWNQDGEVETLYLRFGNTCTGTNPTAAWTSFSSNTTEAITAGTAGHHAVTAGDWNGDGWMDLAVGDADYDDGTFRGRVTQRTHEPGTTALVFETFPVFHGDQAGAGYGDVLAAADVDGDGADELFIAAPHQSAGADGEGSVWLVPGWPDRWSIDETAYSEVPVQAIGFVASPPIASGDFNADGFSDLVTYFDDSVGFHVRHGSSAGLPASADYVLAYPPLGTIGCGANTHHVSAGDVTGDGFDDVLVTIDEGFPDCHGGYFVLGTRRALYLGSAFGLDPAPLQWFPDGSSVFARAEIVGDVNGDGFADVLNVRGGDLQLFLGSELGLSESVHQVLPEDPYGGRYEERRRNLLAGDLDGDELTDVVVVTSSSLSIYHGALAGLVLTHSQGFSPTTLGLLALTDMDGDGFDDLLVEETYVGLLQLWRGSPTGFTESTEWWSPPLQSILLACLDGDGDGLPDLLFGGPDSEGSTRQRIHRGSVTELERIPQWWGSIDVFTQPLPEPADFDGDGRLELPFYSFTTPTPSFRIYEVRP